MSEIDYGLLLGSTNDSIWDEEIAKTAGGRAMRKAMIPCETRGCHQTPRQHFQNAFDDAEFAALVCDVLAPYEHETPLKLTERLAEFGSYGVSRLAAQGDGLAKVFERILSGGKPERAPSIGVVHIGPDGLEGGEHLPPQLRALLENLLSGGDDPKSD